MPSTAAYTPLETLLFFQSVARYGADFSTIIEISKSLSSNKFIRENDGFNASKLAPEALQSLYETVIHSEQNYEPAKTSLTNGHLAGNSINRRKRKLSTSPPPQSNGGKDAESVLESLVNELYAKYKAQAILDISKEEEEYRRLTSEVQELEQLAQVDREQGPVEESEKHLIVHDEQNRKPPTRNHSHDNDVGVETVTQAQPTERISRHSPVIKSSVIQADDVGANSMPAADDSHRDTTSQRPEDQELPRPPTRGSATNDVRHLSSPSSDHEPASLQPRPFSQQTSGFRHSPVLGALERILPLPSPYSQQLFYGPLPMPSPYAPASPGPRSPVILPPPSGMAPMRHPMEIPSLHRRTPSGAAPSYGPALVPPNHQQYPPYTPYQYPQAGWPPQSVFNQTYPQHALPYSNQPYYPGNSTPRQILPSQTPVPHQYAYYHQTTPGNHLRPANPMQQALYPAGPARQPQPLSSASTPALTHSTRRTYIGPSGSSTPWTPKTATAHRLRLSSPERPVREISPFSDHESSRPSTSASKGPIDKTWQSQATDSTKRPTEPERPRDVKADLPASRRRGGRRPRRGRGGSRASSTIASRSRSQSMASYASESRPEITVSDTIQRVKREPPGTPAAFSSDTDQHRTISRRGGRGGTLTSHIDFGNRPAKRKRENENEVSASPSLPTPRPPSAQYHLRNESVDPSLVPVSKNFARVAGPLVNDITAHKLAGIFAKPLSEREAPGYKNLIYRPQDLKTIKVSVNRGSRAANAAIEELTNADGGADTPSKGKSNPTMFLVQKTEDLNPPKAIVNSSQLEMELMRVFANAVMFNPLPSSERGFGPSVTLQAHDDQPSTAATTRTGGGGGGGGGAAADAKTSSDDITKGYKFVDTEEGGIIWDTREMFESVEKAVDAWRSLEQGMNQDSRDVVLPGSGGSGGTGIRQREETDSDLAGAEETLHVAEGDEGETGTVRKRRRVADAL